MDYCFQKVYRWYHTETLSREKNDDNLEISTKVVFHTLKIGVNLHMCLRGGRFNEGD